MKKNKNHGFTLIELMVVMAIMGIVGTLIVSFVKSSSTYYNDAEKNYQRQSQARIAMTYITLRLRENDVVDGVVIYDDGTGIKVKNSESQPLEVYFENGVLKELLEGKAQIEAKTISKIESLELVRVKDEEQKNTNQIIIKVGYKDKDDKPLSLEQTITFRCALASSKE